MTWQTTLEKPPPWTREKLQHSLRVFRTQDGVDNHPRRDCTEITANDKPEPVFNTRGRARAAITREMSERKLAVFPTELLSVKVPTEFTCLAVLCGVHPINRQQNNSSRATMEKRFCGTQSKSSIKCALLKDKSICRLGVSQSVQFFKCCCFKCTY